GALLFRLYHGGGHTHAEGPFFDHGQRLLLDRPFQRFQHHVERRRAAADRGNQYWRGDPQCLGLRLSGLRDPLSAAGSVIRVRRYCVRRPLRGITHVAPASCPAAKNAAETAGAAWGVRRLAAALKASQPAGAVKRSLDRKQASGGKAGASSRTPYRSSGRLAAVLLDM